MHHPSLTLASLEPAARLLRRTARLLARTGGLLASGAGVAGLATGLLVLTAGAAWGAQPSSDSVCSGLRHGERRGSVALSTSVPPGATLRPGDTVHVAVTWKTSDWSRPDLHKVLHCLTVDGAAASEPGAQEKPTDNDGDWSYSFTVPPSARAEVCDRVRLAGRLRRGAPFTVQKSEIVCFEVAGDAPVPAAGTPLPKEPARPVPGAVVAAPAPETVVPVTPAPRPAQMAPPAPPVEAAAVLPIPTRIAGVTALPRTGSAVVAAAGTGAVCVLVGSVLHAGARRRR